MWDIKFSMEIRDTPPLIPNFFHTRFFPKHRRVPSRSFSFRSSETYNFRQNRDDKTPFLCIKIFDTRVFSKHRRVPLRKFSVLWHKKFSLEKGDVPFLCMKFFELLKCSTTNVFRTLRRRKISTKLWRPPPPITRKFLIPEFFWNREGFCTSFSALWDKKNSTEKRDTALLMHKRFRYLKLSDAPKCSPSKFFSTVRQKILNDKSWYPLFAWNMEISGGIDLCRKRSKTRF